MEFMNNFEEAEKLDKLKGKILKYVLYKKRTEQEIRQKFLEEDENLLEDAIEYLKEAGYINDKVYIDTINGVIKEGTLANYKVLSIPIRFNTTYTIALDSYEDLYYTTAILNNNGTLIKKFIMQ